jgi:hypothetical protein
VQAQQLVGPLVGLEGTVELDAQAGEQRAIHLNLDSLGRLAEQ